MERKNMFYDTTDPIAYVIGRYNEMDKALFDSNKMINKKTDNGFFVPSDFFRFYRMMCIEKDNLRTGKFLDLGSGDGRIVRAASFFFDHATGIEADPELFNRAMSIDDLGILGIQENGKNFNFINDDYMKPEFNFSDYDVIYWFPDSSERHEVEKKLAEQLMGTFIIHRGIYQPKFLFKSNESYEPHFSHYVNMRRVDMNEEIWCTDDEIL